MANVNLDKKMKTIQALLDRADHPNTPEGEADSCRAKAEEMMVKYRIEESELIASGALAAETITPVDRIVNITPSASPYLNTYYNIMIYVAQHVGARMKYVWGWNDGVHYLQARLIGYESDIRFAETLFTNARVVFADRMEPKPRADMTDQENVYRMRSAGMERIRIAKLMGYGDTNSATAKVTNMYKRECKKRGEDPTLTGRGMSVKAFRESYSEGFLGEFYQQLWRARNAIDTGSAALVLAGRKEAVDEAYYERFPNERPGNERAIGEGKASKNRRARADSAAMRARMDRMNSAAGRAGSNMGRKAAREVNVESSGTPRRPLGS